MSAGITVDELPVRAEGGPIATTLYRSDGEGGALVILAPGAGAPRTHPFMVTVAEALARAGVHVRTLDFAYTTAGRKLPDRMPQLTATYRAVLEDSCERLGGHVFLGGKSMGARVACEVARYALSEGHSDVRGVLSLGYPLAPKGREKERAPREALLVGTALPHLVVQGAKDAFGGAEIMPAVVARAQRARLVLVPDADHGFEVPKRTRGERTREEVWAGLAAPIAAFVKELAPTSG